MADVWALKILSGPHLGAEIMLDPGTWVLGRHDECDLVLTDNTLAERHLELQVSADGVQVSVLAEGQNIYLSGEAQPHSFMLPPHTVAMTGSLYFAVGLSGQPWPEMNIAGTVATAPSSAPQHMAPSPAPETVMTTAPAENEQDNTQIPTIDDRVDEEELKEPEQPASPQSFFGKLAALFREQIPGSISLPDPRRLFQWLKDHPLIIAGIGTGIVLAGLMVSFIWLWGLTDPVKTAQENITPAQKAEGIISQMDLKDLRLRKMPDGAIIISGYVSNNTVKNRLLKALTEARIPHTFSAVVMNEMRVSAAAALEQYGFKKMSIELDTTPGSLVLSGYAADSKEVSKIRDILKQEVYGLRTIVDQVEYQATRLKALRTMLKEKNLSQRIRLMETPGKIILKGRLTDASQAYHLKDIVQEFRKKYQDRPKLVIDVTLPATDLESMQPILKIRSVSLGQTPYVILENGEKYLRGAKLKNGYILEGINLEYLTLKLGQERIKYFIGGSNGQE